MKCFALVDCNLFYVSGERRFDPSLMRMRQRSSAPASFCELPGHQSLVVVTKEQPPRSQIVQLRYGAPTPPSGLQTARKAVQPGCAAGPLSKTFGQCGAARADRYWPSIGMFGTWWGLSANLVHLCRNHP